jgi:hypothetical protein
MAYSYGRQFRRIAAEAITTDRAEMRALIARILPPPEDGGARVLQVKTDDDCKRAPAAIVAAFLDDVLTGDEAADLLRQTEGPALREQVQQAAEERRKLDCPVWGPPLPYAGAPRRSAANEAAPLVKNNENTSAPRCDAANEPDEEGFVWRPIDPAYQRRNVWDAPAMIKCRIDTTTADRDAAEPAPEPPPP